MRQETGWEGSGRFQYYLREKSKVYENFVSEDKMEFSLDRVYNGELPQELINK